MTEKMLTVWDIKHQNKPKIFQEYHQSDKQFGQRSGCKFSVAWFWFKYSAKVNSIFIFTNSADPDEMQHSSSSHYLGLNCLHTCPSTHLWVSQYKKGLSIHLLTVAGWAVV